MNAKIFLLAVLIVSVFLIGCTSNQGSNYAAYNQPQGQAGAGQPPPGYVGGGCGVAAADNNYAPIDSGVPAL